MQMQIMCLKEPQYFSIPHLTYCKSVLNHLNHTWLVSVVLVTYKLVSDLEADHTQQQEGRKEGVEEKEVKCVSGQSAGIAFVNDLTAMSERTGSRQRSGTICNDTPKSQ